MLENVTVLSTGHSQEADANGQPQNVPVVNMLLKPEDGPLRVALTDLLGSRFAVAEEEYQKSRASCTAASDHECAAGAVMGLGFTQAAQENFGEAAASYREAVEELVAGDHDSTAEPCLVRSSQPMAQ